jgi:hypothetical protein
MLFATLALVGCDLDQRQLSSGNDPLGPSGGSAGSGGDSASANAGSAGSGDDMPDGPLAGSGGTSSGGGNGGTGGGVGVLASVSNDDVLAAARADLESQPAADRFSLRYVALTNRAGASASELDQLRWALAKAVNSVSNGVVLVAPTPVSGLDGQRVLYRLDMRAYGWERAVYVGSEAYPDGWEAILGTSPYALAYAGDDADALAEASGTDVPLLLADHLIAAALDGDLYYGLLEVPFDAPELLYSLGADVELSQSEGELTRVGSLNPHVATFEENVAERVPLPDVLDDGSLWLAYAEGDQTGFNSVFIDPVGFSSTPRLALFSRPNGLIAFAAFDEAGERVPSSEFYVDESTGRTIGAGGGCMECHGSGPVRMTDEIRAFAETFGTDVAALEGLVPEQDELDALFSADRAVAAEASSALGVPADLADDPTAEVLQRYARALTLDVAAGELGVTSESLAAALPALDPVLAPLGTGGTVTRADFARLFRASACALQASAVNRPNATMCSR